MNRFLLAIALISLCVSPALATGRTQGKAKHQHPQAEAALDGPSSSSSYERAKKRVQQHDYVDPYWEPCDYSTNWGPNACGGN